MSDYKRVVVIDLTAATISAGFAGDSAPQVVLPSIVGDAIGSGYIIKYVWDEAQLAGPGVKLVPACEENGCINNWHLFETLLRRIFEKYLQIDPAEHPILITAPPLNPYLTKEQVTSLLFDTFSVPALCLSMRDVLSLYASGRTTGLLAFLGTPATWVTCIYEGYALEKGIVRFNRKGATLADKCTFMAASLHSSLSCLDLEKDLRQEFLSNIVLASDAAIPEGFADQLQQALAPLLAPLPVTVTTLTHPYPAWVGGSKLAAVDGLRYQWISSGEYADIGPAVVHARCVSPCLDRPPLDRSGRS